MRQNKQYHLLKSMFVVGVAALSLAFSPFSFGWNSTGHMTVGNLADQLIKGRTAEAHVKSILGTDGTLKEASIWPDCAKSIQPNQDFKYIPDKR